MNFTSSLAKKYIKEQKRHSMFTMLSIMAAVMFITVIFNLFSTYIKSYSKVVRADVPWHASVYNLTQEESEAFEKCRYIEKTTFVNMNPELPDDYKTRTSVIFSKDVPDCENAIYDALEEIGISESEATDYPFELNVRLLSLEFIGFEGRFQLMQIIGVRKINCVNAIIAKFLTILKLQPNRATLRSDLTQAVR